MVLRGESDCPQPLVVGSGFVCFPLTISRLSSGLMSANMSCRCRWISEAAPEPEPEPLAVVVTVAVPEPEGAGLRARGTTSAEPFTAYTHCRDGLEGKAHDVKTEETLHT